MRICDLEGCGRKHKSKGHCDVHYKRMWRHGTLDVSRISYGQTKHEIYKTYRNIMTRCFNKNNKKYPRYGGRGITVCERWLGIFGFANFIEDMGNKQKKGLTIDRINNDGNYCKENCRWATQKQQQNNKTHASSIYGSPNKKSVINTNTGNVYGSMTDAAICLNLSLTTISRYCSRKRVQPLGLNLKFYPIK